MLTIISHLDEGRTQQTLRLRAEQENLPFIFKVCAKTHDDRCLAATSCLASIVPFVRISMANKHSSIAEKKSTKKGAANCVKLVWDLIKRPKSANVSQRRG